MRWCVVLAAIACLAACKVVNSTRGDDAGSSGEIEVGFTTHATYVNEAAGSVALVVTLSSAASRDVSVMYALTDGTAMQGSDYAVTDSIITFSPGETTRIIPVSVIADGVDEPNETFTVDLRQPRNAVLGIDRNTVTIGSSATPTVQFDSTASLESEGVFAPVYVAMDNFTSLPVTVHFTYSGTATAGSDYVFASSVTFAPGSMFEAIGLDVFQDGVHEDDETIEIQITSATNAMVGVNTQHVRTVRDVDLPPTVGFATSSHTLTEGNDSSTLVTATVALTGTSTRTVVVPFHLDTPTTADIADYAIATTSPLVFPPGTTTAQINITVNGDTTPEGLERLQLRLGPPTNALTSPFTDAFGIDIVNDDALGAGAYAVLLPYQALADVVVLPPTVDTNGGSPCATQQPVGWIQAGHVPACVVFARTITVDSTTVRGSRGLVLAATESIHITGSLDVSSRMGIAGPAALTAPCDTLSDAGPRSGGAGGSFMTAGGHGGAHMNPSGAGGLPGAALMTPPPALRGGCPGQQGGDSVSPGGHGGGAVYLVAGGEIDLQPGAVINASGAGALPGTEVSAGGGGGGSGGMIVLFAQSIQAASAFILANGGGGGEGNDANAIAAAGGDPIPTTPLVSAPGGTGNMGGNGGRGFAQGSPAGAGASGNNNNGAGGGGGGAGYIQSNQPLTGATVSPAL